MEGVKSPAGHPTQDAALWMLIRRRITCGNPFYVLSAAFVIHSTGLTLQRQSSELPLEILVGLVAGYLVLLAAVCVWIVRQWQVWEDARSIPMILVLLMLECSLCFENLLMSSPATGTLCVVVATVLSCVLAETVIRLLRLKFPAVFRVPLYLQIALFMLAGAPLSYLARSGSPDVVRWTIYGAGILFGLSILLLIPAARRGPASVAAPHCPWIWPIHPWSLFVMVWLCLGLRLFTLTLSFDPAVEISRQAALQNLDSIFAGYFLVPMILAIGWLCVEGGVSHQSWILQRAGLASSIASIAVSMWMPQNAASQQFLTQYVDTLASPVWCSSWAAIAFTSAAWLRGVQSARVLLIAQLLWLGWIDPNQLGLRGLTDPHPWSGLAVGTALLTYGLFRRSSRWSFVGASCLSLTAGIMIDWTFLPVPIPVICLHLIAASALLVALIFRDHFAKGLAHGASVFLFLMSPLAVVRFAVVGAAEWQGLAYLAGVIVLALLLHRVLQDAGFKELAFFAGICLYVSGFIEGWQALVQLTNWKGLNEFLIGIALLHLGLLWSARRAMLQGRASPSESVATKQTA